MACGFGLQALAQPAAGQPWTVKDVIHQQSVGSAAFSPDARSVIWEKRSPSEEKDAFVTHLMLTRLDLRQGDGFREVALTRGDESSRNPVFSADGTEVYFLSSRNEGKTLWAMSLFGGEPYAVDSFSTSISGLHRLNDSTLVFAAEEGATRYEQELERIEDNTVVVEDTVHFKADRLFAYSLKSGRLTRLTANRFPLMEWAASRDGAWIVSSHVRSPHFGVDGKPEPEYVLWNVRTGSAVRILASGYQQASDFQFAPDGKGFYFQSVRSSDPEWQGAGISLLHYFDLAAMQPREVPLNWAWGVGSAGYQAYPGGVLVSLANGPTDRWAALRMQGGAWASVPLKAGSLDEHFGFVALSEDGKQAIVQHSTASQPVAYRICPLSDQGNDAVLGEGALLSKLNPHLDSKPKARSEVVRWTGALKDEITGILFYPHAYKPGRAYPLVVAIHGGPSAADKDEWQDSWAYYPNLLAQRGAFVLMPNYHGSSNHGQAFVESIKKRYYELEVPDIMAGIEYLAGKGLVTKDSLGVMGWSNGAILTTSLILQYPDLFKVAAPGAGDVNWISDYGTCEFGITFDQSYLGGAPWDDTKKKPYNEVYILKSPIFEIEKIRTPVLIHHGSEDRAVPRDQSWEYYRGLQQVGKAPVRFLWYPGEPHGLRKITHQTRKLTEELAWIDRYLFGKPDTVNEALQPGSPLTALLEQEAYPRQDGWYGVMENKVLIPEVAAVRKDSIAIGRFEVTNAQYQQWKTSHRYPADQGNYPAAGISLADARGYCAWLSAQTGRRYRLPSAAEARALHELAADAAAGENTMAYWAGYELTDYDVEAFRKAMAKVRTTLLKPAGQFGPAEAGEAKLYDLGGNVSEWFDDGAAGGQYGYSAWDYADPKAQTPVRRPEGVGFRVVCESK